MPIADGTKMLFTDSLLERAALVADVACCGLDQRSSSVGMRAARRRSVVLLPNTRLCSMEWP